MFKKIFQRTWPALLCILTFLILAAGFFSPLVGGDKVMFQHDILQATGMAQESVQHLEETGKEPLWTNSMFSGMPAYQIKADYPSNYTRYLFSALTYMFGYDRYPITSLWMLMTCMFLMLLVFKVNVWAAAAISIGYGFTSFNIIGIEAGHANKIWTLMYSPLLLAGVKLTLNKRYILGAVITAVAMALNVYANHLQITYYIFIAILVWMIVELIFAIKQDRLKPFLMAAGILVVSAGLGIMTNAATLWTTYEYGKESTRGGSDITLDEDANDKGLDYGYIFNDYSNSKIEILTLLVPNFMGGASTGDLPKDSEVYKAIRQYQNMPTYWGNQRYTAGPYYFGAIICFLFILGLLLARNNATKWWLIITAFLALSLSMGKNSLILSDLFFNYFPFYSKFRTPTMFIGLAQILFATIGALGIRELMRNDGDEVKNKKMLNLAFYITGGLCLFIAVLGPLVFPLTGSTDVQYNIEGQILEAFKSDRGEMMRNDAFRSLLFVALAFGLLWAYTRKKLNLIGTFGILALLIVIDLWSVDKRYMDKNTYKSKRNVTTDIPATKADQMILKDTAQSYRVFNMSLSAFNDATTSYYHKSVGGYHGAKLRRYQELIEHHITPEIYRVQKLLENQQRDFSSLDSLMQYSFPVLNMLNTKYVIINKEGAPLLNPYHNGNAWFVSEIRQAENPTAEILSLSQINTKTTAVVDKSSWQDELSTLNVQADPAAEIKLVSYKPNHLIYASKATKEGLAVFSEIYYPYGWEATIDGEPADHFRCNFVLRCMRIPAGEHTVEFRFNPKSYVVGEKISLAGSWILILACIGAAAYGLVQLKKSESEA